MNWSNGARNGMIHRLRQVGPPRSPPQITTPPRASRTRLSATWDPYVRRQQE
jgi:hypothetical protein